MDNRINSFVGVSNGKVEQPVCTWTANGANKQTVSQHMFWLRNKKNNCQLRTLIWGPG